MLNIVAGSHVFLKLAGYWLFFAPTGKSIHKGLSKFRKPKGRLDGEKDAESPHDGKLLDTKAFEEESPESTSFECNDPLDMEEVGINPPDEEEKLFVIPRPTPKEVVAEDPPKEELQLMMDDEAISFCPWIPPKFKFVAQEFGIAPGPKGVPMASLSVVLIICWEDLEVENWTWACSVFEAFISLEFEVVMEVNPSFDVVFEGDPVFVDVGISNDIPSIILFFSCSISLIPAFHRPPPPSSMMLGNLKK